MKPNEGKKIYDSIPIPEELNDRVKQAIASKNKDEIRSSFGREQKRNKVVRIFRRVAVTAAGLLICLTVGVNSSEAFAREMGEVPVLGALAKVLTVRSYHGTDGDYQINMDVPEIVPETTVDNAEEKQFTGDINAEIQKIVDNYMEQAKAEFQEYKDAFFETGGTEEEWADRTMDISIHYDVKYQKDNILSLELVTSKGWVASEEERYYYNLDLSSGKYLTLEEVLGENYVAVCNESIVSQIQERIASDENMIYFGFGENAQDDEETGIPGFSTVDEETQFYLNGQGHVVIVFPKYSIAPGYMGFQEFEIAG